MAQSQMQVAAREARNQRESERLERSNPWLVLVVLCAGFFMILLDTTIVNIAVPSIIDGLKASLDQILWVLNAYILVYAVLLITAGRLGDLFGQRNLFTAGLVVFTIASALCGLAQNSDQLILWRVIQGVGGALLTPQTLSLITTIFPAERRGAAFGVWGAVAGVAAVTGPTLGGFIVTRWSWPWIFYVNVPIGIVAAVAALVIIPDVRPGRQHSLDLFGVLLATLALLGIVFGLIDGQRYDWSTVAYGITIPEIIAAGGVLLVAFFVWERFQKEPLVPLSLFRNRNFSLMNWVTAAMSFGMLGLFLPLTIYLQSVRGLSALNAGLTMVPMPLTSMVVAPIAGRLSDRLGGKYILMSGLLAFAVGMGGLTLSAGLDSTWVTFLPWLIVAGFGMGCIFAPASTVAMRNIEPRMAGAASGVFNTTRQLGGTIGSAVVGAVLQDQLSKALRSQASSRAGELPSQLPDSVRQKLIDSFNSTHALQVGRGQSGAGSPSLQLPANVPPAVAHQIQAQIATYFHDVFVNAYLIAMRPSLFISVAVLVLAAISCFGIQRRKTAAAVERATTAAA